MTRAMRSDRTERLLAYRLEELAGILDHSAAAGPGTVRLLELASVATANAVTLELLSADRAERIWRDARERHPALAGIEASMPARARAAA